MRNVAFVMWILGWNFLYTLHRFLCWLYEHTHPFSLEVIVSIIYFYAWFKIAKLLYEPKDKD